MQNTSLLSYTPFSRTFLFPLFNMMETSIDLKTLLSAVSVKALYGTNRHPRITNLALHSQQVRPHGIFFAIPGHTFQGLDYVNEAWTKGAEVIVTETFIPHFNQVLQVQVADVRQAVAQMARVFYQAPDEALRLTGITGTKGKTTTSWLLQFLYQQGLQEKTGLIGTLHNDLGQRILPSSRTTPDVLTLISYLREMVVAKVSNAVVEVSSQGIDQKRVYGLQWDTAVFTNLGHDHLDYHHTMEEYFSTKRQFFLSPSLRQVVVNVDDPYGRRLIQELPSSVSIVTVGIQQEADLQATQIRLDEKGTQFTLRMGKKAWNIQTPLWGSFNVSNILAALGVLQAQGYDIESVLPVFSSFPGVPGRLEKVPNTMGISAFVDFAHTPESLQCVLEVLRACMKKKLYVVFGCGGNRDRSKRPFMMQVAETYADHVWATADNPRYESLAQIFQDMRAGHQQPFKVDFVEDRAEAVHRALQQCQPGDCILLAGEGTNEMQEVQGQFYPSNDRKMIEAYFQAKQKR